MDMRTALNPWEDCGGAEGRQQRGLLIAANTDIKKVKAGYSVPSQSSDGYYLVWYSRALSDREGWRCTCPDFEKRNEACKHIIATIITVERRRKAKGDIDGPEPAPATRPTYSQNWPAYNKGQQHEGEHFRPLLRELCNMVPEEPQQGPGRPRLPLGDMVYCIGTKIYSGMSSRRVETQLREASDSGLIDKSPSFASVCRYLEDPALYPVLRDLVQKSAVPLKTVEDDFAVDSTGFSSSVKENWMETKWGKKGKGLKTYTQWVKAHAMCGTASNVVTAVEATHGHSADSPYLPQLLKTTTEHDFHPLEVSGDKAYASKANIRAIIEVGATAYLMFKNNARADQGHHVRDRYWEQSVLAFLNNRDEWLDHYHKRSNIETVFAMVKAKFGKDLRSRNTTAQVNETLAKFLCHNICVVIQSMYELGTVPNFGVAVVDGEAETVC